MTNPPGALDCLSDLTPLVLPPGYEDAEVILSISGGKDSAAAALRLRASREPPRGGCLRWGMCEGLARGEGTGADEGASDAA